MDSNNNTYATCDDENTYLHGTQSCPDSSMTDPVVNITCHEQSNVTSSGI